METRIKQITLAFAAVSFVSLAAHSAANSGTTSTTLPKLQKSTQGELKPHVGIQIGHADSGSSYGGATSYGVEVGYQPYVPLAAALELQNFSNDGAGNKLDRTSLMAKGTYNFGGNLPILRNTFVGAGLGPIFDTAGADETNVGAKVLAGLDFPLTASGMTQEKSFSLGATAQYLAVMNASNSFIVNAQLKYWF